VEWPRESKGETGGVEVGWTCGCLGCSRDEWAVEG
jgi:hypothetical protein